MTLLVTLFAAVIATIIWYARKQKDTKDPYKPILLVYMFWGASLMWLVDLVVEYIHEGNAVFTPGEDATLEEWQLFFHNAMNDLALGLSVVALALVIWVVYLLIADPKGVLKNKK